MKGNMVSVFCVRAWERQGGGVGGGGGGGWRRGRQTEIGRQTLKGRQTVRVGYRDR